MKTFNKENVLKLLEEKIYWAKWYEKHPREGLSIKEVEKMKIECVARKGAYETLIREFSNPKMFE